MTRPERQTVSEESPAAVTTRSGYVAILGLPNAGKSTLLNRILGEKLAITSPKPQTTRRRLAGIWTRDTVQIVFVDTPGLLDPAYALQRALAGEVGRALEGVDLVYLVRDVTAGRATLTERGAALDPREDAALAAAGETPMFLVLNKSDRASSRRLDDALERGGAHPRFAEAHAISASTGAGIERLLEATAGRLPEAAFYYDPEQLTDRNLRFLAGELVREALFEVLHEELPYATHVDVTEYAESRAVPRIEATIFVERESQKGIVIGRGGETLKRIGSRARAKVEGLAGGQVFLQLTVKVRPNWRRKELELRRFGYEV